MKTRIDVGGMLGTLAMVILLCAAAPAYADLTYDFESLNSPATLTGQDSWASVSSDLSVASGPAGSVDTTKCAYFSNSGYAALDDGLAPVADVFHERRTQPLMSRPRSTSATTIRATCRRTRAACSLPAPRGQMVIPGSRFSGATSTVRRMAPSVRTFAWSPAPPSITATAG